MIRKTNRQKKYFAPQNDGHPHPCDFPGCNQEGLYRAPKDKTLKEYYWFCLKHVTQYNANWNYDLAQDDSFDHMKAKKMRFGGFASKIKYQFGYDFINELGDGFYFDDSHPVRRTVFSPKDRQYAALLGVVLENLTIESLKKQYKKLARKYHPDMNAGNKESEELFKKISTAYHELLKKLK